MKIFWKQYDKFTSSGYYSDEELETSKAQLRNRILYDSVGLSDFCKSTAFWWASTGLDYYEGYLDNLAKINRKDINNYLQKYVIGKPYVMALAMGSADAISNKIDPRQLTHEALAK